MSVIKLSKNIYSSTIKSMSNSICIFINAHSNKYIYILNIEVNVLDEKIANPDSSVLIYLTTSVLTFTLLKEQILVYLIKIYFEFT